MSRYFKKITFIGLLFFSLTLILQTVKADRPGCQAATYCQGIGILICTGNEQCDAMAGVGVVCDGNIWRCNDIL